jgi:membrane protein implicated in regulation of membrane protease activity
MIWRRWTRPQKAGSAMLNGVPGMIGETAVVTNSVADRHQPGSVKARGEEWYAVSMFPGTTIDVGTTVVVADVDRGLLVVYPTDDA